MYLLAGIPHITTLIAPPLSGVLMRIGTWIPFTVSVGAYVLGLLVLALMPEPRKDDSLSRSPLLGPADTLDNREDTAQTSSSPQDLPRGIHDRMPGPTEERKEWWRDLVNLIQMPGLPFCYVLFLLKPIAMISKAFVYQYASYNFHWGLSTTTWLRFSQAIGSTVATIVILPLLLTALNRRGLEAQKLDLDVIRASLFIAMLGFLLLQFSFHGWMLLLGIPLCASDQCRGH